MRPMAGAAGVAGILAGLGLALEFALFVASGWSPEAFASPDAALALFATGGAQLRAAGAVGVVNLGLSLLLLAGLADRIADDAPTAAATTIYSGLVGAATHALVPLGLWLGIPAFVELAAQDPVAARSAWSGYAVVQGAAGGAGYFFGGAALVAAGVGLWRTRAVPPLLGWIGALAGGASVLSVLGTGTPIGQFAAALFLPALLLTIAFRVWAGLELWQSRSMKSNLPAAIAAARRL